MCRSRTAACTTSVHFEKRIGFDADNRDIFAEVAPPIPHNIFCPQKGWGRPRCIGSKRAWSSGRVVIMPDVFIVAKLWPSAIYCSTPNPRWPLGQVARTGSRVVGIGKQAMRNFPQQFLWSPDDSGFFLHLVPIEPKGFPAHQTDEGESEGDHQVFSGTRFGR